MRAVAPVYLRGNLVIGTDVADGHGVAVVLRECEDGTYEEIGGATWNEKDREVYETGRR